MVQLYARDLLKDHQTDAFMGKGFEEKMKQAEAEGKELVVGEYYNNEDWIID